MIDEKRIAEIRERCGKATPGPWEQTSPSREYVINDDNFNVCMTRRSYDAEFIAHAREDIPYLLGEIDRLKTLAENGLDAMDRGKRLDAAIAGQETLQKTLADHVTGTNELKRRIARLEEKLAESQRREQAALKDLKHISKRRTER